jgi:hypothetical protein
MIAVPMDHIPLGPKITLLVLCVRSCEFCGLVWLGNKRMQAETRLGETALRGSLKYLVTSGLLIIHAYPQGGRGRATEYIVLPGVPRGDRELSTAPCGKCQFNQINPARRAGNERITTTKPRATRGVSAKPRAQGGLNPVDGYDPTISNTPTITARASAREAETSPAARSESLFDTPQPPTIAEVAQARRTVAKIERAITASFEGDRGHTVKDGSPRPPSEGNGATQMPANVSEVLGDGEAKPD